MSEPTKVIRCDECRRVIAVQNDNGTYTHVGRHDRETHTTTFGQSAQQQVAK